MKKLQNRLDQILPKIESDDFKQNQNLSGEIGFYVFDYPAEQELVVREHIKFLTDKLNKRNHKFVSLNLFQIIIDLLESRNLLDKAFQLQKAKGDDALFKALKGPLEQNRIADFIAEKVDLDHCEFILLDGLGSAWPIIRGHGLLNALHAKVAAIPTVLFYPGEYDGSMLKPFGTIESNNYYRAFKLVS